MTSDVVSDPPWVEYARWLILNKYESAYTRFCERAWAIYLSQPEKIRSLEYSYTQAWIELRLVSPECNYQPQGVASNSHENIRPGKPTFGYTKSGHLISIEEGRSESDQESDPVLMVSGEGWLFWDACKKHDILVKKSARSKVKQKSVYS
jgi:hypothetical protein